MKSTFEILGKSKECYIRYYGEESIQDAERLHQAIRNIAAKADMKDLECLLRELYYNWQYEIITIMSEYVPIENMEPKDIYED